MNKINLQEIVGGQLQAKFERSFEKVIENLQDPNTSFKVKRGITIKLDFTQNEDRDDVSVSVIRKVIGCMVWVNGERLPVLSLRIMS